MSEIYWITRLDAIMLISILTCIFSGLAAVICFCMSVDEYTTFGKSDDYKVLSKIAKKALAVFLIALPVTVFCPSKKDMLAIWGLGGTIDYIQSNDKTKELPDKVIDALDKYFDTITAE